MGVKKLGVDNLPGFPFGIDTASESFPKDTTGNPLVRFDWKKGPDHLVNSTGLDRVYEHVKNNGPGLWPAAASALSNIHIGDLRVKVVQHYTYMSTQWKKKRKLEKEAEKRAEDAAELAAADGIVAESEAIESAMTTSGKSAHVGAVSVKATSWFL
jgi:hypothetical protein